MEGQTRWDSVCLCLLLSMIFFFSPFIHAHPYMYYNDPNNEYWNSLEEMASQMDDILDSILVSLGHCPQWSQDCAGANSALWRSVIGQDGPSWETGDNGAVKPPNPASPWNPPLAHKGTNTEKVFDSRYLGLLDAVLDPNRATNLPSATVSAIRQAFEDNIQRVLESQIRVDNVRFRFNITGCDNDFTITYETNTVKCVTIRNGFSCLGSDTFCFDIPSLFTHHKGGPLAEDIDPRFDDAMVNMTAAYMTLGDIRATDYWYSFCGHVVIFMLENYLDDYMRQIGKGKGLKLYNELSEEEKKNVIFEWELGRETLEPETKGPKAVLCNPWEYADTIDFTVPVTTPIGDINLRVTINDADVCYAVRNFVDTNIVRSAYNTQESLLAVSSSSPGDLNGDGRNNFVTHSDTFFTSNINASSSEWALREDVFPNPIILETQPVGRTDPPLISFLDNWTLSVAVDNGDGTVWTADNLPPTPPRFNYQWLYGTDPGDVNIPWPGGNVRVLNINPVNWVGSRYFRCLISDTESISETYSNIVELRSISPIFVSSINLNPPPPIYIHTPFSITCIAQDVSGGQLIYQWQIDRDFEGPGDWENVTDGNNDNVYQVNSATISDQGMYRCVITSMSNGLSVDAGPVFVYVYTPTPIVTLQPVGAMINVGGNHTFTCNGDITPGGGADLRFIWEKNRSALGPAISGPGPVQLSITNAQSSNTGWYRCKIVSATYGTYVYTDEVYLGVGIPPSGTVIRVDKNAPRPGGVENGLSWATAFDTIQEGIDAVASVGGGEVWVAGGPNGGGYVYNELRTISWGGPAGVEGSLILEDNVQLYGGFSGYWGYQETDRSQRSVRGSVTIIDGSQSRGGAPAYHVIVIGKETLPVANVRIDGFDIRGGRASGVPGDYHTWRGGGIYNWMSKPVIANCTFYDNQSAVSGGAIANETFGSTEANAQIINCVFYQNQTLRHNDSVNNPIKGGGAIFNNFANPKIKFSTFVENGVNIETGGLFGLVSSAILNYNTKNDLLIHSSIFWQNSPGCMETLLGLPGTGEPTVVETDIQQLTDPEFASAFSPPVFKLSLTSPFLNASSLIDPNYDIRGVTRPQGVSADRGAYETVEGAMTVVCKDISVYLDDTGQKTINATDLINYELSNIPAGIKMVLVDNSPTVTFSCSDIPSITKNVIVIDNEYEQGMCVSTVTVNDSISPIINLRGNSIMYLNIGEDCYIEPGASWTDNCDGIGEAIIGGDTIPSNCPLQMVDEGVYNITYNYTDSSGNSATEIIRTVYVGQRFEYLTHPMNMDLYVDSAPGILNASFKGGYNVHTYEWIRNGFVILSGPVSGTELSLTVDPTTLPVGTYYYQLRIYDEEGRHDTNESRVRIGNRIRIIQNISDAELYGGQNFTLTVLAEGGIGTLNYYWQKYTEGEGWREINDEDNISGSRTNSLQFNPFYLEDVGKYRCVIYDEATDVVLSNEANLIATYQISVGNAVNIVIITSLILLFAIIKLHLVKSIKD